MTQLNEHGHDRVIVFFANKLSSAEREYTENDREVLPLILFLERYRGCLEGSKSGILTDNQVLKHFLTKHKSRSREASLMDTLGNF